MEDLEYENNKLNTYWSSKPPWCQPWSILTTGFIIILLTYIISANLFITIFISLLIFGWWFLFLIIAPSLYHNNL